MTNVKKMSYNINQHHTKLMYFLHSKDCEISYIDIYTDLQSITIIDCPYF